MKKRRIEVYQGKTNTHYDTKSWNDLRRNKDRLVRKQTVSFKLRREQIREAQSGDWDDFDIDEPGEE